MTSIQSCYDDFDGRVASAQTNSTAASVYLFKVNNGKRMCEISSKLKTLKTLERRQSIILLSLLVTLNRFHTLL